MEPTAEGLDVICEGFRLVSADDLQAIERGRIVYDALYARLSQTVESGGMISAFEPVGAAVRSLDRNFGFIG